MSKMKQFYNIKQVKTTKSQNISQFCITTVTSTKAPRCVTDVAKPRLKALCLSTTPNIIFGATVKDTLSKADDIFNFQCPQSKTTKKHLQKTTFGATGHSLSTRKHFQSCQVDC